MAYPAVRYVRLVLALLLCVAPPAAGPPPGLAAPPAGQRVILRLEGVPLGLAPAAEVGAEQVAAIAGAAQALVPGIEVERTFSRLLNGIALRLPGAAGAEVRERLRRLPGVAAVYEEHAFYPTLYSSAEWIGAPEVWASVGGAAEGGRGVRVAVIDSGIDPAHAILAPAGLTYPPGYPLGDARYTTAKVIAARLYVRPTDPPAEGEATPVPGPLGSSHGTHLAGIVAGAPVTATYQGVTAPISGVAPAAWLMNYRVFYPAASGEEVAYTTEILAALEDAVADGADVILAGWASASGVLPWASPLGAALEAASDAGCVVVAPAGNAGPALGSASRLPGGHERVVSVGATSKPQEIVRDFVDVLSPEPVMPDLVGARYGRALFGPAIGEPLGPLPFVPVWTVAAGEDPYACAALPAGSLEGTVAVIRRGECPFADKAYHAQNAGAVAALIVNTDDAITEMACSGTHCGAGVIRIPSVMVGRTYGDRLVAWGTLHADATLQLDPGGRLVEVVGDVLAGYSARGPAYARQIEPDVVAPGEAVLSAGAGATAYTQASGTSVAAAHVAGAAALLLQVHPAWGPDDVRAALMGAAAEGVQVLEEGEARPALPLEQGAGRIDVAQAAGAALLADPPSLAAPTVLPGTSAAWQVAFRDVRASGPALTYTLALTPTTGLSASLGGTLVLSPGESVTRTVQVTVPAAAAPGDVQTYLTASTEDEAYRLPLWVHVAPPLERGAVLVIDNDFSQIESYNNYTEYVEAALDAAGIGHTVWDADKQFGSLQTIPDLVEIQEYAAVVWVTGDNVHPDGYYELSTPLTTEDQRILARYLDGGGRLLAVGQNLAEASDVNPSEDPAYGRGPLVHEYLGAHWLTGSLFGPAEDEVQPPSGSAAVVGLPGTFLEGVALDLGDVGDGAGNQVSIDEIAPGGFPDGADLDHVLPVLAAAGGEPEGAGYVGVAKVCAPGSPGEAPACPYRTLYYSFGPEGINDRPDMTTRAALFARSVAWLLDEVTAALDEDLVGAPREPVVLAAEAASSHGEVIAYRWEVAGQVIEATQPSIAVLLDEGVYPVTLRVHDSLGHTAYATSSLRIVAGGGSALAILPPAANPGETVTLALTLRNEGLTPLAMSASLPLPAGLEYVSHEGGQFADGVLTLAGNVPGGETLESELVATVGEGAVHEIVAVATVTAGAETFTRSARLTIGTRMHMPLVTKEWNAP